MLVNKLIAFSSSVLEEIKIWPPAMLIFLPPSASIYTIVDAGSGTTVVPFDDYSHLDCDATGSYIMLDTKPLYKNRFYELSLKTTLSDEVYFSRPFRFKVV